MKHFFPSEKGGVKIYHNKKDIERLIFPAEGPYTMEEELAYDEFWKYVLENGGHIPTQLNKRRIMRFLVGNRFNIENTYNNIQETVQWRDENFPIILTKEDQR